MVHGYHLVLCTYGTKLPNTKRFSWAKATNLRTPPGNNKATSSNLNRATKFPLVRFSGQQALAVIQGFSKAIKRSQYRIWALSILPNHVHLVEGRHRYKIEQIAIQLKGAATRELRARGLHPITEHVSGEGTPRSPWARKCWHGFLDTEHAIECAMNYVMENPRKAGLKDQHWECVQPFPGIDEGCIRYD